jgi:glycosyltransferase involved in cell wall biosynthesis
VAQPPAVSVVIPTLGRRSRLATAVGCALGQTGVDTEAIVVIDGPGALEWERLEALRRPGVRVLASPQGDGVADARNRGMAAARGEHVAFLDDDDLWAPDKLARQLAAMRAAGAGFGYGSSAVVGADLRVRWIEWAPPESELSDHAPRNNPIPACSSNLVVRTDLARAVGFDPGLMHFADWDFALRLIREARGARCPDVLVGYVWHEDNMHVVRLRGIEKEFRRFRAKLRAQGVRVGSTSQSRWVAGCYRQSGRRVRASAAYLSGAVRYRSAPDVVRAAGVLLGERAMSRAVADRRSGGGALPPEPEWLAAFR